MESDLIKAKLKPYQVRPLNQLQRTDTLRKLDRSADVRISLIHAPAGYGKTGVGAALFEKLTSNGDSVAWLSCDGHDVEPVSFLKHLGESCLVAGFLAESAFDVRSDIGTSHTNSLVSSLVTALNRGKQPRYLIVDDFHRIDNDQVCSSFRSFLEDLTTHVHVILISRQYPQNLGLSNFKARSELLEINAEDLRFGETEIKTYLGSSRVSKADIEEIERKTEGWPIALMILRSWLDQGYDTSESLGRLSGRSSDVSEYFFEQVFNTLLGNEQQLLLKTSILERVTGDLADHVCKTEDSWQILEQLEKRDIFIEAIDVEKEWFRYQRMFTEFLHERLRRSHSAVDISELHKLASDWFKENGFESESTEHALSSQDGATIAARLEELGGWKYALRGNMASLERTLQLTDSGLVEENPRLHLGKIFVSARNGEVLEAEMEIDRFKQLHSNAEHDDSLLRSERLIMQSLISRYSDKEITEDELRALEELGGDIPNNEKVLDAVRQNLLCTIHARQGSFERCIKAGERAIKSFRAIGSRWGEVFIYYHQGVACMSQARLRDAQALYKTGLELAEEHFGMQSDLAAIGRVLLSEMLYEVNQVQDANRLLERALLHIEDADAWLEVYVAGYTTAIKIAKYQGDEEEVEALQLRAASTSMHRGIPRLKQILEIHTQSTQASSDTSRDPTFSTDLVLRFAQVTHRARFLISQKKLDDALALLNTEIARSRELSLLRCNLTYLCLKSIACWMLEDHGKSTSAFAEALEIGIFEGMTRAFVDEGIPMLEVIRGSLDDPDVFSSNRMRDRFLTEVAAEIESKDGNIAREKNVLSKREREVMLFVVQGRSNREISEAMDLSINTVKFHVKNVFEKLGVTSRGDAVSIAFRQGLL